MKLPTTEDFNKLYASNGNYTKKLAFWELSSPANRIKHPPIFTLKQAEFKGLPSAYQVYMESIDEYDAASKLVPNMKIWDDMTKPSGWFFKGDMTRSHQGLEVWREHKRAKDASEMKGLLKKKAKGGDTTAAKALLQETKTKAPVGRKTNTKTAKTPTDSRVLEFKRKTTKAK